jgi:hypothetical protein
MSCVLYYSKYCEICKKLIYNLGKTNIKDKIHFLNIDKRINENGKTFILLENGQKILLPPNINMVPALLLLSKGNKIIFGNDVENYFIPLVNSEKKESVKLSGEPLAFSLYEMGTSMSDNYSYLDQTSSDLSAKGNGGTRQMHSFVKLNNNNKIETPPEDYIPDKIGEVDLGKIQQQRQKDIEIKK